MNLTIFPEDMGKYYHRQSFFTLGIATSLGDWKFWNQTRPGEGWASSNYSCLRYATWVVYPWTNPVIGWVNE